VLIVFSRQPRPDAADWPGRRVLSLLDAIVWPAAWFGTFSSLPMDVGLVGTCILSLAIVAAVGRSWRALFDNARYRFTTYQWGVPIATLCVLGLALKALA
jgi:hypothetical protein